jgi:hypothetical protein
MPILTLDNFDPSSHLQKAIGERYAMESRIIVLENNETAIKLVLAEPYMEIMEELRKAVPPGKTIEYYLARHSVIDECFCRIINFLDDTLTPKGKEPIGNKQQSTHVSNVLIISNENRRIV